MNSVCLFKYQIDFGSQASHDATQQCSGTAALIESTTFRSLLPARVSNLCYRAQSVWLDPCEKAAAVINFEIA